MANETQITADPEISQESTIMSAEPRLPEFDLTAFKSRLETIYCHPRVRETLLTLAQTTTRLKQLDIDLQYHFTIINGRFFVTILNEKRKEITSYLLEFETSLNVIDYLSASGPVACLFNGTDNNLTVLLRQLGFVLDVGNSSLCPTVLVYIDHPDSSGVSLKLTVTPFKL